MVSSERDETVSRAKLALEARDFRSVVNLLTPLATTGDAEAQFLLGYLYLTECEDIPADAAFDWLVKAAKQDHAEACYHLATFPGSPEFTSPLSGAQEAELLMRAGELGSIDAQYNLGASYATGDWYDGWRGPRDDAEAVKWYSRAADHGNPGAQYSLGFMLLYGEGGRQDSTEGIAWLEKAAGSGEDQARRFLADIYEYGLFGVARNPLAAERWGDGLEPAPEIWPLGPKQVRMLADGRFDEVERHLLDFYESAKAGPDSDLLRNAITCLAHLYSLPFKKDSDQAERYYEELVRLYPTPDSTLQVVFFRYYTLHDLAATIEEVARLRAVANPFSKRHLGFLYTAIALEGMARLGLGQLGEAEANLRELLDLAREHSDCVLFGDEYNFVNQIAELGVRNTVWRELVLLAMRGTGSQEYKSKFERLLADMA
jgi:TPR repeat protein